MLRNKWAFTPIPAPPLPSRYRLAMPLARSFPPVVADAPRVLVLGSMPGARSLAELRYYAHPRNLFWTFMGELFGAGWELPYDDRLERLGTHGIALWDVLAACERSGSLDAAIVRTTEVPNPIPALLEARPTLTTIACNGATAHALFLRHVAPAIPASQLRILALPSTSPANASIPLDVKRRAWAEVARCASARPSLDHPPG